MADDLRYVLRETDNGWHWELRAPDGRLISSGYSTDAIQARAAAMLQSMNAIGDVWSPPAESTER